uniref:ATP synthase complex subunit 8 n=1 Tax=Scombrolabrax heterolepis TaxID=372794 RepID=T2HWB3_9SCOM|nr:ATP synthase F0 subunit 8 [Scombrolabrax heterolepis]BAN83663.1 ATPase subunit 8 [Scombrolabrax heterolepis]
MPQLQTRWWYPMLMFSWLAYLAFMPPKLLTRTFPKDPTDGAPFQAKVTPWQLPWN